MFSDLHLAEHHGVDTAKPLLEEFCHKVRTEIPLDEDILLIFMGDLIEKGAASAFQTVREILNKISQDLSGYNVSFEFLPGNHDLTAQQLVEFDHLIAEYGISHSYMGKSVYSKIYEDVNFIFADSNLTRDHKKAGQIDKKAIYAEIKKGKENLLFCHHGFTHSLGGDHDCVSDGWALSKELRDAGIRFLFHGHTHRADLSLFTDLMTEFGCGSLSQDRTELQEGICHQFSTGYLRDGKLIQVERWIALVDGNGGFAPDVLYPKARSFADPDTIGKISFSPVRQPYLSRKVRTHGNMWADRAHYTSSLQSSSLQDACMADNRLILLGDAGQGKSIELQNLAYELNKTHLFPFLYVLRDYTGDSIHTLLPREYHQLHPGRLILIFDAYDELSPDVRATFEKELNAWAKENALARILISSRENFCKSEENSRSRTFPGFAVYDLCTLSPEDIAAFLEMRGIDPDAFYQAAQEPQVEDLLKNPFYLNGIANIFLQDGSLPDRANIMARMIQLCFSWDDERYSGRLEDRQYELFSLMERVAFATQLMQENGLEDGTVYQRLFSLEERDLIRQSGLLTRSSNIWRFTHNNFREYLTAKYLADLPLDEAASYFSADRVVKLSWLNTLGYLISLWPDDALVNWLIESAPGAVVKFESNRITSSARFDIFKRLFLHYAEKDLVFSNDFCNEKELGRFACVPQAVDFLLEQISPEAKRATQYNALLILQYFPRLFDRGNQVLYRLLTYCAFYPETMASTCRLAVHAIYRLNLASVEATRRLLYLFGESKNDYIRLALYEYLTATNQQDANVDFFLNGIQYAESSWHGTSMRIANERFQLKHGFLAMSSPESVARVLKWFTEHQQLVYFDGDTVFSHMAQEAAELYRGGVKSFFGLMVKCCSWACRCGEFRKENDSIAFFKVTDTLYPAVLAIVKTLPSIYMSRLFQMHPELFDCAEDAYFAGEFPPTLFQTLIPCCVKDAERYTRCAEYIREREGVTLPDLTLPVDYDALRRRSRKTYFAMLFDQKKACQMFSELVEHTGQPDLTIGELHAAELHADLDSPLLFLLYAIRRNVWEGVKVKDAFEYINWKHFSVIEAAEMLKNNRDLEPTPAQRKALCADVCKAAEEGIFQNAVQCDGESTSIPLLTHSLLFLAINLDCDLPQEAFLHLTEIPEFFFGDDRKNPKYGYLARKLPQEDLSAKVLEDLSMPHIGESVLQDHIEYCGKIRSDGAAEIARRLCIEESSSDVSRHTAFQYLYNQMGNAYVESEIVPQANGELLCHISTKYPDISRSILKTAMEERYQTAPTPALQSILIAFGSQSALQQYTDTLCRTHALPAEEPELHGSTGAVATVHNPCFLPLLGDLLETALSPDFRDREFDGLLENVTKAFLNCGKEDAGAAIAEIERHLPRKSEDEKRSRRCNYIIEEILHVKHANLDMPWPITQVEKLIKKK